MLICSHEQTHVFSEKHFSRWHNYCHCLLLWQIQCSSSLSLKGTHSSLKINDLNYLNLSPLSALQLRLSDVCFHSDTHKVFLGQSKRRRKRCVAAKNTLRVLNQAQVRLVLRTWTFYFSQWIWKHYHASRNNTKNYNCLKINCDYIPRRFFPTASSLSYELVISISIMCSLL